MRRRNAFTLTELLVVLACIAVLVSLLLPVAAKARSISRATTCLSNLRAIGDAWTIYMQENNSALIKYNWSGPTAYDGYWFGILDQKGLRGDAIKCPAAYEPSLDNRRRGYGTANIAWTGQFVGIGSALRLSKIQWRDGSYAYNRYLNAKNGFGPTGMATSLLSIKEPLSEVPTFMDCAYADVAPPPMPSTGVLPMPPDLTGTYAYPSADPQNVKYGGEHWSLIIARHDKAINVAMADGSARLVPLTDLYQLSWRSNWNKAQLTLP
jgi:prepilin-type N-terminal cleavage/methylation domain-containing protein/prepilin-type processing-associated H-X9-DG protein